MATTVVNINGREVQLKDAGLSRGGQHKYSAQVYVPKLGTVYVFSYQQEEQSGQPVTPPSPPRPAAGAAPTIGISPDATMILTQLLGAITERLGNIEKKIEEEQTPPAPQPSGDGRRTRNKR